MLGSVITMQLSSSIIRDGSQPVLIFAGEIDLATVPECSDMLTKFVDDHAGRDIAIDLCQVTALKYRLIVDLIRGGIRGIKRLDFLRLHHHRCHDVCLDLVVHRACLRHVLGEQCSPSLSLWLSRQPTWRRLAPE